MTKNHKFLKSDYLLTYSSCSLLSFSIVGYVCIRHSNTKMKNGSIFYFWIWMPSNMYMCGIYNIHTVNPTSIHFIFLKKIDKNGFWILGPFSKIRDGAYKSAKIQDQFFDILFQFTKRASEPIKIWRKKFYFSLMEL